MQKKEAYVTEIIQNFDLENYVQPEALQKEIKEWQAMEPVGNEIW